MGRYVWSSIMVGTARSFNYRKIQGYVTQMSCRLDGCLDGMQCNAMPNLKS